MREMSMLSSSSSSSWSSSGVLLQPSDSSHIRSRYLHRLGVAKPQMACKSSVSTTGAESSKNSRYELLKEDYGKTDETISIVSPPQHSSLRERASVRFEASVEVRPIPKHTAYSSRIRSSIWTHPAEAEANVARNVVEFAAENWDWRQTFEEKDMVYLQGQEQPVHPVHLMRECNMQRQFCKIMSAQQHQ